MMLTRNIMGNTNRFQLFLQTQSTPIFQMCFSCKTMPEMVEFVRDLDIPWHSVFMLKDTWKEEELLGSCCAFQASYVGAQ